MIVNFDLNKEPNHKYGFKATISTDALVEILRDKLSMPEGNLERIRVDDEHCIVYLYFRGTEPVDGIEGPQCGRLSECGEYPERCTVK